MESQNIDLKKFKTVKDYAVENNITVQAVYKRVKAGKLKYKTMGSYILIDLN